MTLLATKGKGPIIIKKYEVRNGKELSEEEYIAYLEGMAEGIFRCMDDDYAKWNDPLYINSPDDVYSYVFDFHDGGRHHKFTSLFDIYLGLVDEVKKINKALNEI
jgi:hypothetical protein